VSEIRVNPLTGERVLTVPGRARRPGAIGRTTRVDAAAVCPFCEGHEDMTPPEVDAFGPPGRAPDTPGWTIRVVPNKFPALPGQEVVIHGPPHATTVLDTEEGVLEAAIEMWARRRAAHHESAYLLAGINEGAGAGASLPHSHSQLVPYDELPPFMATAAEAFAGPCPLCPLTGGDANVVWDGGGIHAVCPDWARFPYEAWILPQEHDGTVQNAAALATALRQVVGRLFAVLGDGLSWNAALHDAPLACGNWHWWLEVSPRITVPGLIELGSGLWVNVSDPAQAAAELRQAQPAGT
jgi:UDPglucose--hexose-1-phosphate uridylyltransferase